MNITILGHVCIDHNKSEGATYTSAGGPASFMFRVFNYIPQVTVNIISPYGKDFFSYLQPSAIYPKEPNGEKTLIYENSSQANLKIQKSFNREFSYPPLITDELLNIIQVSDIIFVAPLTPFYDVDYVKKCLTVAKKDSLKILLPRGYYRDFTDEDEVIERNFDDAEDFIPYFNFIITSEQDHHDMMHITRKWAKETSVIMTLGEKGAMYLDSAHSYIVSTKPVSYKDIIDSVGAGDIFSAIFGYKYYLTHDVRKSMELANNIARQCLFSSADNLHFILPKQP
ncbi:MAG: PfkB family carbohydrate kinase [Microgenomates group bacterium]